MSRILTKSCWIALAGLLAGSAAWAADSPIGALTAEGKVTLTGQSASFTLQDQEYAYFSGDRISTDPDATARVRLSDGLDVTFIGSSGGRIASDGEAYTIELAKGHIVVDARDGVDYRITHDGQPVSRDQALDAEGGPFVASVAEPGSVQFYMPAQLDDDDGNGGPPLSGGQIATILTVLGGGVYFATEDDDDDGPSS